MEFEIDTILKSINNDITKELARYIFTGENATLFENKENYTAKGIIVTSNEDEIITTSDANNKILLNASSFLETVTISTCQDTAWHEFQNKEAA